ncbi:MAG: ribosome silencing factor [Rhodoluna sp.]
MTATKRAIDMTMVAATAASEKLGENLVALDVSIPFVLADTFLIASGRNDRQVAAISDSIEEKMLEAGHKLLRREGKTTGRWILLDFGDIICHVMHEEDRVFYDIERLWKDCPVISLEAIKVPQEM